MTETIVISPIEFRVFANLIPSDIDALADTTPFTATDATLTVLTNATIDGHSLKRLKVMPSW